MQCTTWKDTKQVMFLVTNRVGFSRGLTVKRHVKWKKKRETILELHAHADYIKSMNGADRNDRDSRDYSTSIRTSRWYLCIFCWAMDRDVHSQHSIVIFLAEQGIGIGKPEWKKYRDKNQGQHDFQIDLGISLSTMVSTLTGMENHKRDLATCEKAPSSLVNARCVSFV